MYMIMTDRGWRPFHELNKPCPNSNDLEGVHQRHDLEIVRDFMTARATRFAVALDTDQFGMSFNGDRFNEPLFGAFGEKL